MKKRITIRLDADILDWFKSQEGSYQSRINDALRIQMGRSMDKSEREGIGVPVYVKPKPKKPSKIIDEVYRKIRYPDPKPQGSYLIDEFFKPRPKK